jgi:NADPH-dependent glutamate synthase beta subunit-like oxidoreductase
MKVVLIIGGAVSGSTAAKKLTENGIRCIIVDQNRLPYGKIEDGLPRWHDKQRINEYSKIDEIMGHDLVDFVPSTKIGKDISFEDIYSMNWSCIYFANGAWKDRNFPIDGIDNFSNFYYQNPFVYWFNHYHENDYNGPEVNIQDNVLVVGGGLASIDVCKITQMELVKQKIQSQIKDVDVIKMEHQGIPKYLEENNIKYEDLDIKGTTLIYRRDIENMPLTTIAPDAKPELVEKRKKARRKILNNTQEKFLFNVSECTQPIGLDIVNDSLEGLEVIKNEIVDNKPTQVENSNQILKANTIISSIGSLPEPIDGIPMSGSTYDIIDEDSGKFNNLDKVHGMGNAITGKGNIKASRISAKTVGDLTIDLIKDIDSDSVESINNKVKEWQGRSSYNGNYFEWKSKK